MIRRTIETSIEPSVQELAEEFCHLDAVEQAEFFNLISEIAEKHWPNPFAIQAMYIAQSGVLTAGGKQVIEHLHLGG